MGGGLGLIAAIGGFLLLVVLVFAVLRNRQRSRADVQRTEQATHNLYQRTDAEDKASDPDTKNF
ncbi:hypothetical protein [Sphingomonas sp.]|uniref:hypothetical protein n=1 Tax=Sphingomonas sp. TaxID=28214 RepID=UPI003B3A5C74